MKDSAFCNADGDFLLVPQTGSKLVVPMPYLTTSLGNKVSHVLRMDSR